MGEFILKYWVEWLCGLVAAGIVFMARHYVKLQKKDFETKWEKRKEDAKMEVSKYLHEDLEKEIERSTKADEVMKADIEILSEQIENVSTGVLSIQGKQFRDMCLMLLESDHTITVQEYEQFEEDYAAYKALGGNHRGDALHARVVDKFTHALEHIKKQGESL